MKCIAKLFFYYTFNRPIRYIWKTVYLAVSLAALGIILLFSFYDLCFIAYCLPSCVLRLLPFLGASNLFFFKTVLMWTIFTVFLEFIAILLLFHVLVFWQQGVWDLSSPTRDRNRTLCTGRWMLNPWNARDVPRPPTFSCDFAAPSFKKDYMKRNREKSCHLRFSRTTDPQQTQQGPQKKVQPWGRPAEKSPIWAQP